MTVIVIVVILALGLFLVIHKNTPNHLKDNLPSGNNALAAVVEQAPEPLDDNPINVHVDGVVGHAAGPVAGLQRNEGVPQRVKQSQLQPAPRRSLHTRSQSCRLEHEPN